MAIILGIDIGKQSVRGAVLRTSMRAFEVDRYVEVQIPSLTADTTQAKLVGAALTELLQRLPSGPDSVMASVDGMRGSLRTISIPLAARKRAAEVLPFELEALLPFAVEEAIIDYQEQGVHEGQLALLTAAVPEAAIAEALELWEPVGTSPRELCVGALALEGALSFLVQPADEPWLFVHLDVEQSDACIVHNGMVQLCRTFDEGSSSLRDGSRAVHGALHQTLMKYRAEGGPAVRRLIVMGEAALDGNVVRSLGEALSLPAEAFTPPASKSGDSMVSPVFGKALALAGRALRRGKRIDLRKGKFAPARGVSQLRNFALLAAGCTIALVSSYTFSVWAEYRVLEAERNALSERLSQVTEQHFGEKTTSVTRARELLDGGGKPKDPLPRFDAFRVLGVISNSVALGVVHDTRKLEITFDEGGQTGKFELQGQIPDLAARDAVAEAIEGHECIEQIERGKTSTTPGQDRKSYLLEGTIACPGAVKKTKGGAKPHTK